MKYTKFKLEIIEWFICFAFFFRQAARLLPVDSYLATILGGNLDPFYLIVLPFLFLIITHKKISKWLIVVVLTIILLALIQFLFLPHLNVGNMIINIVKIFICLSILYIAIKFADKINYRNIVYKCTILVGFFTAYALTIGNNSDVLWRMNDYINKYSLKRLMLFYLEPSELGFHLAILIIFLVPSILNKESKHRFRDLCMLIINLIALFFAKPMGAICCLAVAVVCMVLVDFVYRFKISKVITRGLAVLVGAIIIVIMFVQESSIIMRVIDTINGTDASNNYRVNVANEVLTESLIDFKGLGCGFGNGDTPYFLNKYGIVQGVVNSYGRFIIEAGLVGIVILVCLWIVLLTQCIRQKDALKYGLFAFIFIYQFVGSHFTNALIWWLYGYIISKITTYKETLVLNCDDKKSS